LKAHFRPEFLNRVDEIITYHNLGEEQIHGIVLVQLKLVVDRLKARRIELKMEDSAVAYLAKRGFDPVYGARPLKRAIQTELLNPISKKMIEGSLKNGDTLVVAELPDHKGLNLKIQVG